MLTEEENNPFLYFYAAVAHWTVLQIKEQEEYINPNPANKSWESITFLNSSYSLQGGYTPTLTGTGWLSKERGHNDKETAVNIYWMLSAQHYCKHFTCMDILHRPAREGTESTLLTSVLHHSTGASALPSTKSAWPGTDRCEPRS